MRLEDFYTNLKIRKNFRFTLQDAAEIIGYEVQAIRRRIKLPNTDQEYIKAHKNGRNNTRIFIYAEDLEDYLKRTEIGNGYRGETVNSKAA